MIIMKYNKCQNIFTFEQKILSIFTPTTLAQTSTDDQHVHRSGLEPVHAHRLKYATLAPPGGYL